MGILSPKLRADRKSTHESMTLSNEQVSYSHMRNVSEGSILDKVAWYELDSTRMHLTISAFFITTSTTVTGMSMSRANPFEPRNVGSTIAQSRYVSYLAPFFYSNILPIV